MLRRIICLLFFALPLCAQESSACSSLQKSLIGHAQILRDYSADAVRAYVMQANEMSAVEPALREFALFTADAVRCDGNTVSISGKRSFAVQDAVMHTLSGTTIKAPMTLTVTVKDEPLGSAAPRLQELLFWSRAADAVDSVPSYAAKLAPATFDTKSKMYVECSPCHAGIEDKKNPDVMQLGKNSGVKSPKLLKLVDPEFTEEFRQSKQVQTMSRVGMLVGPDGKQHSMWLLRAAGLGLDEKALEAVSQYRFAPATKAGAPVTVWLVVEVNFTMRQ